ncbi:ComF family protein [Cohnella thailandensis]|uniref:ComF family protein n=1 Tax=Cohnella thailandensis TaxID=557557 RepID=A0A841SSJ7_9BACL|nr:ComF family protein [Cohnella thailandensis]MBP1971891.1 ComF family protein [Cohnella thailandensis]
MSWSAVLHSLLQPRGQACLLCGQSSAGGSARTALPIRHPASRRILLEGFCSKCLSRIPWIVAIACPVCGRPERCGDCLRRPNRPFVKVRGAVRYDAAMKELLALYKYRGLEKLEPALAAMLSAAAEPLLNEVRFDVVTSVPIAERRLEDRGFDQAERIAMELARLYRLPYRRLLKRTRHTGKQSFKGRKDRIEDMKGTFAAIEPPPAIGHPSEAFPFPPYPVRILLVDDIYTTGSTMTECSLALKSAYPDSEVYGAMWARS